jgi:hypothetical protein
MCSWCGWRSRRGQADWRLPAGDSPGFLLRLERACVSLSLVFGAIGPHRPDDADLGTSVEHETQPIANLPKWCPGPGRRDNFSNRRLSSASLPRCACCGAGCWRCRGGQPLVCGFSKSSRRWDGAGQETPACVTETVQADCAPDGARRRSAR